MEITKQYLLKHFYYDPGSGLFIRMTVRPLYNAPRVCNTHDGKGYLTTKINGKGYRVHRLIWLYMMGRWPVSTIDHINGDGADNRWVNLREATPQQNNRNNQLRKSKSGYRGVEFIGRSYRARIRVPAPKGQRRYKELGKFPTAQEAHEAYQEAAVVIYGEYRREA